MKCSTVMEWLPHYIEGLLSPEAERDIARHIQSCPACARWLEEARAMEELWLEMDGNPDMRLPAGMPDLVAPVMEGIERMEAARTGVAEPATLRRRFALRTSWVHYGVAACLTFALLQFGIFEQLGYGLTEINGQMSNSVTELLRAHSTR